jgi:hypothetical protein
MKRFVGLLVIAVVAATAASAALAETAPGGGLEIVIPPPEGPDPANAPEGAAEGAGAKAEKGVKGGKADEIAAKSGAAEGAGDKLERMKSTFADFCEDWVDKLRERERWNVSNIKWETSPDGAVVGEYVGYDTSNIGPQAQTVGNVDKTPIGKLVYLELRLRRTGSSKEEALGKEPEIVERTEVTEIFRFDRGHWIY